MDKSRQYIQMCKTSKEIQDKWKQTPGDLYVNMDNKILFWTNQPSDSYEIKNGFKIENDDELIRIEKFFWLPNRDQLIELAQVKERSFRDTSFDFFEWTKKGYASESTPASSIFRSIEQLWLGYVMEKIYSKMWINSGWESR